MDSSAKVEFAVALTVPVVRELLLAETRFFGFSSSLQFC
jgi:hypothetical protein